MALTNTDKTEIERIARAEIKEYLKKAPFKKTVMDMVEQELNGRNTKLGKSNRKNIVNISSDVLMELYKTFWLRRSFWNSQIKNV
jgi:hypothetical protein|tara:strand:- start:649 stop:903 length:255 start_codon:yes stop_codon:yes gene_type:complete